MICLGNYEKILFNQRGNVNSRQRYMKPAYQAARDGVEAKEASKENGSTEPIYAGSVSLHKVLH